MLGLRGKTKTAAAEALELKPRLRDVVFGHMPKTAGTSMRNIFAEAMPGAAMFFDYGSAVVKAEGDVVTAANHDAPLTETIIALRTKMARRRPIFVAGHIPLRKYLGIFHPAAFVTFLRDPVDRVVSTYRHYVQHMEFTGSFADFYAMPRHINMQSRMLYGVDLRTVGFIGLTEQMPDMLEALGKHFDLPLRARTDNISTGDPLALSDAERREVAALNGDDVQLYEHVKAHLGDYTNLRGRKPMTPLLARGAVKHFRDGLFRGIVTTAEPGRLAAIDVLVDGRAVHRCFADEYRVAPEASQSLAPGRWGFTVDLPMRMVGGAESIRFVLSGTKNDFTGSPFKVTNGAVAPPQQDQDETG